MVQLVEDPERHQGLHLVWIQLWKADVQVQKRFPDERVEGQLKPLDKLISVDSNVVEGRLGRLIGRLREPKLNIIRHVIELPNHV